MPNLTPVLIATTSQFGKKDPVSRVILNPADAALLKEGEFFTTAVPPSCLIGSAVGILKGIILVLQWNLIPKGQVSVLEGGDLGMFGALDNLQPDPHCIVPIRYGDEPLYELGEEVDVRRDSDWPTVMHRGVIHGVLKVSSGEEGLLCLLRTHHLNMIEGSMPPDTLSVGSGIHYWVAKSDSWVPEKLLTVP